MRKTVSIVLAVIYLCLAVFALVVPVSYMEELTESYNLYKEVKGYKKISELKEHLESNNIKYEKKNDNIYIYLNEDNKYADFMFYTIETECKIQNVKYANNFEKLDERKNVKVCKKDGKEYISYTDDGIKYTYSEGKYYVTWVKSLWLKCIAICSFLAGCIIWIGLGFGPKKKEG